MSYICNICGKEFDTINKLKGHKSKCGKINEIIICPICNKEFKGKQGLSQHFSRTHSLPETNKKVSPFNEIRDDLFCQYCGKQCKNKNSLINHEKMCSQNPDTSYRNKILNAFTPIGHKAWNKGLTKETDERVRKRHLTFMERKSKGLYENVSFGGFRNGTAQRAKW